MICRIKFRLLQINYDKLVPKEKINAAANTFGAISNFVAAYYQFSEQKSRTAFEIMKYASIAESAVNT